MMPHSGTGGAGAQRHGGHRARRHDGEVGKIDPSAAPARLRPRQLQGLFEVAQAIAAALDVENMRVVQ